MIKCPECGNDVLEESRFCPYCMHRFTEDSNTVSGNIAPTDVLTTNNKIKKYILLATIIFICVIVVGLCVYGNIVRKTQNNNNQNNQNFVNNESNTYTASPETISKPTGSVIVPTTEQITEPTIKPTDSEKENNTVEPTKPTRPSIESSTESTTQAKEENTTESPTHVKEENTTEPSTEAPTQTKEESTTEEENPSNPPTETATDSSKCSHIYTSVTCTSPSVCVLCGIIAYDALGHDGVATCTKDGVCSRCGILTEKAFGHNFVNRTCSSGGVCSICGIKGAVALNHDFGDGPICKDAKCNNCDYVRKAQSDCFYNENNQPCYEEGPCVFCGEIGINFHNGDASEYCYSCSDFNINYVKTKAVGEKFTIASGDSWKDVIVGSDYKFDTIKDKNSRHYGETVVGIPITYDRLACPGEPKDDFSSYIHGYTPDGARMMHYDYYDDSFQTSFDKNSTEQLRKTEYLYFIYKSI